MMKTLFAQLSEGFSLAALFTLLFPLVFPAIAIADGAGDAYHVQAIAHAGFATVAAVLVFGACVGLSEFFNSLSRPDLDASYTKALHAYLLNGGRA